MTIEEYYKKIYTLSFINRYTNVVRVRNEDVAQHSFFVAAIIMKLHDKYYFDLGRALRAAIAHDMTEADLSDVTHKVKMKFPNVAIALKEAEQESIKKYPQAVIEGFKDFEDEYLVEGLIANLADVIQVQQYVSNEIELGNKAMFQIESETRRRRDELEERLKNYVRFEENTQ